MRPINSCLLLLGGIFLIANASPIELGLGLYERELADLEERALNAKCATCIAQCVGWFSGCVAACGPFEIFTPIACANCIVIFGASQQCFQCVEKCEAPSPPPGVPSTPSPPSPPLGHKLLEDGSGKPGIDIRCDRLPNKCTGTISRRGIPQGLCTVPQYARQIDNRGGECAGYGKASACDISVAATEDCAPKSVALPAHLRFVN